MGAVEEMICVSVTKGHSGMDVINCSELGNGAMSKAGKYLFRVVNVWWGLRLAQYFVIASCG